jgi:ATP-binding cassette subfamily F protein 3
VLGANGAGKSTLIKIIMGQVEVTIGKVSKNESAIVSCFTQHHVDQLDLDLNPLEYMVKLFPEERADGLRGHLGRLGCTGNLALQKMELLSGGQKSRVALAVITFKQVCISTLFVDFRCIRYQYLFCHCSCLSLTC